MPDRPAAPRRPARAGHARVRPLRPVLVLAAGACAAAPRRHAPRPPAGSYELALCRAGPCAPGDTAAAYLTAVVVLLDSADAARLDLPRPRLARAPANGCFAVRHRRPRADSYAGLQDGGGLRWSRAAEGAGAVAFALFRSPDASYTVRVVPVAGGLAGSGASHGVGAAAISAPRDTVVARRIGDADPTRCA